MNVVKEKLRQAAEFFGSAPRFVWFGAGLMVGMALVTAVSL